MIQSFRSFFSSKLGVAVTLAFLGLIAFAFASGDVANTGTFGGIAGGDRVAVVGDSRIDASELSSRASNAVREARQSNPTLSMEAFIAGGGLQDTLESLISRTALADMARRYGLRASSRLVDKEIVGMANMRKLDGSFDTEAFRAALRQQGISEEVFRSDLAFGLLVRQLVGPVEMAPRLPPSIVQRYARLRLETRTGQVAELSASLFAPTADPTQAQLQDYYAANTARYIRPERRVIRYAVFGEDAFGDNAHPTEAQIAQRYQRDRALYAARESRTFTQVIAPTQAAAQAIADEVRRGVRLETSARSKGLGTTTIAAITREALATQSSPAVAEAAFAAERGALSQPAQGGLGWYVLRVDSIERQPERTLAQARTEIEAQLAAELRQEAMNDATARIEDKLASGRSLAEVARELRLELTSTRPLTAAGQIYGTNEPAPSVLAPVLSTAFEMEQGQPQLAEAVPGESFIIFEVSAITPSAAAPLSEIRDTVIAAWRRDEGMKAAGAAAERILSRIASGNTLAEAMRAERIALPAPRPLRVSRPEIERMGGINRPTALFLSMAKGTTKSVEAPEAGAWFIVALEDIQTPELPANNPLVIATSQQLAPSLPGEYTDQFIRAVRNEVSIEINQPAVDAVGRQLTGRGG